MGRYILIGFVAFLGFWLLPYSIQRDVIRMTEDNWFVVITTVISILAVALNFQFVVDKIHKFLDNRGSRRG